jgi:hypothetical protein
MVMFILKFSNINNIEYALIIGIRKKIRKNIPYVHNIYNKYYLL